MDADERQKGDAKSASDDVAGEAPGSSSGPRPEPPRDVPRTATDMVPGIPAGSGEGIERALQQPDTDLGGGVAGDTTAGNPSGTKPDRDEIRNDDKTRKTL